MSELTDLITESYEAIANRGIIDERTTTRDFILKLNEEVSEFKSYYRSTTKIDPYEVADIVLVCFNMAHHNCIDLESILKEKIEINKNRNNGL